MKNDDPILNRAPARDDARPLLERLLQCVVQAKAPPDIAVSNGADVVVLERLICT
jgi:hypothetical protein